MHNWTETHRAFVNTWECDENDHLNVQFYLKRFDEAARIFGIVTGTGTVDQPLPKTRHVRYHNELRPCALTRISTSRISNGTFAGWVVHRLEDKSLNRLAATAVDTPGAIGGEAGVDAADVDYALPRGLPDDHLRPRLAEAVLQSGGLVAHRSIVTPAECDETGRMSQQFYVYRFTDAAPHVWENYGIGEPWLTANGYGRAAVEMKITHHEAARSGDMLFIYSRAERAGRKTIKLRHDVIREIDQTPIASSEVLALILDLKTRKSVPLPDNFGD